MIKNAKKGKADAIWSKLEKSLGGDLCPDREKLSKNSGVIPTGSIALDSGLGIWGLPKGRIIQFAGRESSGKTFMSLQAIKQWQSMAPHNWAYFIDAEYTYDEEWAESLGVDNDRVKVLPSNDGVEIFTSLCGVPHKEPGKPKLKDGLLDIIKNEGGADETGLGIIVIDSIAAIQPPMEAASVSGKNNMALMGRFLPPELRRITPLLAKTGVMLIAINQVRVNPGQLYGNPETTTGGSAWKHHCSVMVNFGALQSGDNVITDGNKDQIGHKIRARIDKNKMAPPKKVCEFDIVYTEGVVNRHIELADLAIKYGVVERPNNRTYVYGGNKWVGKDNFASTLQDEKTAKEVLEAVKEAKLKGKVSAPDTPGDSEEE